MINDLRFALRMLLKQPGFSLITVITLALGIGATSAVFSLIQGVLLTPPPYREPERLVLIPPVRSDGQDSAHAQGWAALQWLEWQKEAKSFESLAAYTWSFNFLIRNEGSESMQGMAVSKDYFRVTGLQPILGRTFVEAETALNSTPVVVIGYDLWLRKFNRDPNILGKSLPMSRQSTPPRIIGVMPADVRFLPSPGASQEPNYNVNAQVDFWLPAAPRPNAMKASYWDVVGRLKAGAGLSRAQAELALLVSRESVAEHDFAGVVPRVEPLTLEMNRDGRRILLPLLGAATLVLLIACGNAAALLLMRGLRRQQEYAVRTALGVARSALFRQVAIESLLLALLAGVLGVGLAFVVVRVFKLIGGHAIPRLDAVSMGWPVLAWALGAAILAALISGLIPAIRATSLDAAAVLKNTGSRTSAGRGDRRLLRVLTVAQTALTLALLVGAGLLIRTMMNLANVQSGYATARILTMSVTALRSAADFHRRALDRVSALPGVENAAFAWGVPLTGNSWPGTMEAEGQPVARTGSDRISLPLRSVTPGYFRLLGQPISQGRDFRSTDSKNAAGVAIVNQAFADRYFAKTITVGRKLWMDGRDRPATEIIGVVANGRTGDLTKAPEPEVYLSFWQQGAYSKHLVVRTTGEPRSIAAAVQRELRAIDPTVAIENTSTLDQIRDDSLASRSFAMRLLLGFAVVGCVLTIIGIYGVLSLSVASRRRELAIRSAVGASPRDIRSLVVGEGFRLTASGVMVGVALALVFSRVLKSFLFEVDAADPMTLIVVGLSLTLVGLLACQGPARRAARVDLRESLICD